MAGGGKTTLQDIARQTGVSTATVSRVLSNSAYPVSDVLRRQIRAAAEILDYTPNLFGRQLKTSQSREIGVIVPTISNPFYARLLLGVELESRKRGYQVLLCSSFRDVETEKAYIRTLAEKQVAGLVISTIGTNHQFLEKLQKQGLQIVACDQNIDSVICSRVGFNFFKGGMLAVDHLTGLGHRNLAYLTTPLTRRSRLEQLEGCRLALLRQGLSLADDHVLVAEGESEQGDSIYECLAGRELTRRFLELTPRPDAIIAVNDLLAMSVLQALAAAHVSVPGDVSVIGFDNLDLSAMLSPALTTIDQPALEMGSLACQVLIGQIEEQQAGKSRTAGTEEKPAGAAARPMVLTLEPELVVRQSTGPAGIRLDP